MAAQGEIWYLVAASALKKTQLLGRRSRNTADYHSLLDDIHQLPSRRKHSVWRALGYGVSLFACEENLSWRSPRTMAQGGMTGILENTPNGEYSETTATTQDQPVDEIKSCSSAMKHCRVCRQLAFIARAETPLLVQWDDSGLAESGPYVSILNFAQVYLARGMTKVTLGHSFYVVLRNLSDNSVYIAKWWQARVLSECQT